MMTFSNNWKDSPFECTENNLHLTYHSMTYDTCSTVRKVGSLLWNYYHHISMFSSSIYIWRQCFSPRMETDEPTDHGWCMGDGKLDMQWMTSNPAPDEVHITKQKIHIYTYAFLRLNNHIKFILVFYRLCRFSNSYFATAKVSVVKIVFV